MEKFLKRGEPMRKKVCLAALGFLFALCDSRLLQVFTSFFLKFLLDTHTDDCLLLNNYAINSKQDLSGVNMIKGHSERV